MQTEYSKGIVRGWFIVDTFASVPSAVASPTIWYSSLQCSLQCTAPCTMCCHPAQGSRPARDYRGEEVRAHWAGSGSRDSLGYQTSGIHSLLGSKPLGYTTSWVPYLWCCKPLGYQTSGVSNLWGNQPLGYKTSGVSNLWCCKPLG